MKFQISCVIALCICLGQICSADNEYIEGKINKIQKDVRNNVNLVGEQFVFDITKILEQAPTNPFCLEIFHNGLAKMLSFVPAKQQNIKIDANNLSDFYSKKQNATTGILAKMDYYKILQATLAKQLPPERYNGILNLFYINLHPNASAEEIATTLNYVYGMDDAAAKVLYLDIHQSTDPVASDCPEVNRMYSDAFDKLKLMTEIKPNVVQDFTAIREKFPCNIFAYNVLIDVVTFIEGMHVASPFKADVCSMMKFGHRKDANANEKWEYDLAVIKSILSTRLPNESFRGLFDVLRVIRVNVPTEEFNKALEYVYDKIPELDCEIPERPRW